MVRIDPNAKFGEQAKYTHNKAGEIIDIIDYLDIDYLDTDDGRPAIWYRVHFPNGYENAYPDRSLILGDNPVLPEPDFSLEEITIAAAMTEK